MPFEPKNNANPSGRPVGAVGKATATAREAIASFIEGNVGRLEGWLDAIADGVPDKKDETGVVTKWIRHPDPDAALKAYMSVIEYHIPKLARAELVGGGPDDAPIRLLTNSDADIIARYNAINPEK